MLQVELVPDGKAKPLSYEDREEYIALTKYVRLHESDAQMEALLKGISNLVPAPVLNLFTWKDLEMRICGRTEIDLDVLRRFALYSFSTTESTASFSSFRLLYHRNTRYRAGVSEQDPHIQYFWKVLDEFGHHERMLFLRFAWGRQRLPSEAELKHEPMKIFPFPCDNPDARLPHAETCFFNIKLPAYSTADVMRDRMLYAITHTKTIDADLQEDDSTGNTVRSTRARRLAGALAAAHNHFDPSSLSRFLGL